jgi:hypothetical protein
MHRSKANRVYRGFAGQARSWQKQGPATRFLRKGWTASRETIKVSVHLFMVNSGDYRRLIKREKEHA